MAEETKQHKNEKLGEVVSTKMAKTIVVAVSRRVPHPLYKRIVTKRKKFYAHDEEGVEAEAAVDDEDSAVDGGVVGDVRASRCQSEAALV